MKSYFRAIFLFFLAACNKEKEHTILLRVENTTVQTVTNVMVGNYDFGDIQSGTVADYKTCRNIVNMQGVNSFKINNKIIYPYATAIDPPPSAVQPDYLNNGNYTITIYFDSVFAMDYRTKFTKD